MKINNLGRGEYIWLMSKGSIHYYLAHELEKSIRRDDHVANNLCLMWSENKEKQAGVRAR